jgi:hypothetical protein
VRLLLFTAIAICVADFAVAQPALNVGTYQAANVPEKRAELTISQAGILTEARQHLVLTHPRCSGSIDVRLHYSLPLGHAEQEGAAVDYVTGDCRGEWNCNSYVVRCRAVGPAPAVFRQINRMQILVKSRFPGTFVLQGSRQKPIRSISIGAFDVMERKVVGGRQEFEIRVKSMGPSSDTSLIMRMP